MYLKVYDEPMHYHGSVYVLTCLKSKKHLK